MQNTNVVKLYRQIEVDTEASSDKPQQHAYYCSGIGTHAKNLPLLHRVEKVISDSFDMALAWSVLHTRINRGPVELFVQECGGKCQRSLRVVSTKLSAGGPDIPIWCLQACPVRACLDKYLQVSLEGRIKCACLQVWSMRWELLLYRNSSNRWINAFDRLVS